MKITRIAKVKTNLSQQDMRNFVVRFKHQIPGLERIPQDQTTLNALAQILQVFANNKDHLITFFFQLEQYLDGLERQKKV